MNLADVTPLVLTYNEAPNLGRCLERLTWAREVVVVDSFSSDETCEIAARFPNVRLVQRVFDEHARQWNFGLQETGIESAWVLSLDADYEVTPAVLAEIRGLKPAAQTSAYEIPFAYRVLGRTLRGTVYRPVAALFRRAACGYVQDGHTQTLVVHAGRTERLTARMIHDDRKPLARWLASQAKYMDLEVPKLLHTPSTQLSLFDRLRKLIVVAPPAMFVYCLLVQGGVWDGWPGWYYAIQRLVAEAILSLKLLEARLCPRPAEPASEATDNLRSVP